MLVYSGYGPNLFMNNIAKKYERKQNFPDFPSLKVN